MTGRVLVVDDIEANVRLLQAKLQAEYYDVLTANEICEVTAAHPASATVGHRTGGAHRRNLVPLLTVATTVVAGLLGLLLTRPVETDCGTGCSTVGAGDVQLDSEAPCREEPFFRREERKVLYALKDTHIEC